MAAVAVRRLHGRGGIAVLVPRLRDRDRGDVRTLALVEVLFAQAIPISCSSSQPRAREAFGIVLIVVGVVLLCWTY